MNLNPENPDSVGITLNPYVNNRPTPRAVPDLLSSDKIHDVGWTGRVLQQMKTIANHLIGADADNKTFPGAHVVSLTRKALNDTLSQRSYYVCEKTDGVRYLLLCAKGQCFLIDRKDRYTWVNMFFPRRELPEDVARGGWPPPTGINITSKDRLNNTLLDGELVVDTVQCADGNGTEERLVFYVFDVMAVQQNLSQSPNECSVVSLPLPDRLRLLHSHVLGPRYAFWQASQWRHMFANELKQKLGNFQVKPKNMYRAEDTQYVLEVVLPNLPHEQDGLIYTPVNKRYTIGTDQALIKWKPPYLNSVDFFLNGNTANNNMAPYYLSVGERTDRGTYEQVPVCWITLTEQERQRFDIRGRVVVEAVWKKDRLTPRWCGNLKTVGQLSPGGWEIIRTRTDKNTSNDIRVFKKIEESIKDNVLEHDLIRALSEK
jgi:mRNA guanylyltransferase